MIVCQAPRDSQHIESGRFGGLGLGERQLRRSPDGYGVIWPIVTFSGRLGAAVLLFGLIGTAAPALGEVALTRGTSVSALPVWRPEHLSHLGAAQTVIVVTSSNWTTTYATARVFTHGATGWVQRRVAMPARVGWNGMVPAAHCLQNDGRTPAGTFPLVVAFGALANPGTALPYRRLTSTSWWPTDPRDPRTYDVWQTRRPATATWRTSWAERLITALPQYDYGVVLGFNLPAGPLVAWSGETITTHPANVRLGGGIFLHVISWGPTAGCVSLRAADLVAVLRLLTPAAHPVIVIGPATAIDSM